MKPPRTRRRRDAGTMPRPPRRRLPDLPALEWAEDMTGRCARVTAVGGRSLLVENHTGILDFTERLVALDTPAGPLRVLGEGLTLRDARRGALIVHGSIRRVELPCEGGDPPDER